MAIIDKQDWIDNHFDVSEAVTEQAVNRFIHQAEIFDLRSAFDNTAFYNTFLLEINKNPVESPWSNLLDPYQYTYQGQPYSHQGIKTCLSYWSYARYLKLSEIASTPFGAAINISEFTQPLQQKKINEIVSHYQRCGYTLFQDVKTYINRFVDAYQDTKTAEDNYEDKDISITKIAGPGVSYPTDFRSTNVRIY